MLKIYRRLLHSIPHLILIATWAAITLYLPAGFWHKFLSLPFLLIGPGYYAFEAITRGRYKKKGRRVRLLSYYVGLSLVTLMVAGLAINEIYVATNLNAPLSLKPLTYMIAGISAVLALSVGHRFKRPVLSRAHLKQKTLKLAKRTGKSARPVIINLGLAIGLPLLAIGGANTLNNGGTNWLAIAVLMIISGTMLILSYTRNKTTRYIPAALFGSCLAILYGTSMRGWNITGHDIMQEYQVFQLTLQHSVWSMHHYQDAYSACLSITILPTIIAKLTGISAPYIYKFVFQAFFALIGPLIYDTLKDYVSRSTALLSTFVFISFPTFFTDIMFLDRQETALLCLALAVAVALDKKLSKKLQTILAFIFLTGMVLSHYSTSYVAVGILLFAVVAEGFLKLLQLLQKQGKKKTKKWPKMTHVFSVPLILAISLILIAWGTLATQTSDNVQQTIGGIAALLVGHKVPTDNVPADNEPLSVSQYSDLLTTQRTLASNNYYTSQQTAGQLPASAQPITAASTGLATSLHLSSSLLGKLYDLMRSAYGAFVELTIALGLLFSYIRRKSNKLPRQYLLLGIGGLVTIAAQVVLPASLIDYGITRVIQEALLFLALPVVIGVLNIFGLIRIPKKFREPLLATVLVGFFLVLTGVIPALTGGSKPTLALANTGLYYQAYYTHQDEVSAAQWLQTQTPVGSQVSADEFMRRKLVGYDDIFPQTGLIPSAIPTDSYVVISHGDTEFNEVPAYDNGQLIYYRIPYQFLNANKGLVYSTGQVLIYK
jgi:uncharacterized membrane protein